ncbi:MAG TPA: class I SAM-dependent methyltransferase [Dehalococcoidia bacterium]|jgi:ubiquinone/menaquinone biosynthesis C-methylase UbiE|nr:class I SAM-dependent methyltransferase [Dehalococcoidia bacterium]
MSSKQYFDEVAPQWDKMRESFFPEAVREKAISVACVQPGKLAADIGAGTGFMTEGLIQRGLRVIAVDQSEAMVAELRRKFEGVDTIDYRIGKAESLPVEDEGIDYVFANMLLHHVDSPPGAIEEMVRILKPGGMLVVTDLDEHDFEFLKTEHRDRWMGFKREDIKRWLTEAGLKGVRVECIGESCCAQSSCGDGYASISIFVASGEK